MRDEKAEGWQFYFKQLDKELFPIYDVRMGEHFVSD